MYLVAVALADREEGAVAPGRALLLDPVVAGDVARIDARVVRRLEPTGALVAPARKIVTIETEDSESTVSLFGEGMCVICIRTRAGCAERSICGAVAIR